MRFKFCGDLDSPDWVLAGISALSGISSIKVRSLATAVVAGLLEGNLDILKVKKLWPSGRNPDEVSASETADERTIDPNISLSCSVVEFILHSAAKNEVTASVLNDELQQLGLPKEHASVLVKLHAAKGQELHALCVQRSLRVNGLEKIEWRIDAPASMLLGTGEPAPEAKAVTSWSVADGADRNAVRRHLVSMSRAQLKALISDLEDARRVMDRVSL